MMRRKWLFWLPEEHETSGFAPSSHADTEACREWTPFLTALFDGEADEEGALRARRHLLVCERCARAWLDWNQTRSLLINHSAPPPPPSLLWRIRLACRLGHPAPAEPAAPQLGNQILALTSRKNTKPALGFASFFSLPRGLRLNAPFMGALAMAAFVLFIARDSLLVSPPTVPVARNSAMISGRTTRAQTLPQVHVASSHAHQGEVRSKIRLASPPTSDERDDNENEPRAASVSAPQRADNVGQSSQDSLDRARHERESLQTSPVHLASFDSSEPLPMLSAPRSRTNVTKEQTGARSTSTAWAPKLAHMPRIAPRPVASAPQIDTPPVMLASFDATSVPSPEPTSAPAPRVRRTGRTLLASAPLRISTPHALPITMSQPTAPGSDDAGLDELDSTVQEYRAALSSDDSSDATPEAG